MAVKCIMQLNDNINNRSTKNRFEKLLKTLHVAILFNHSCRTRHQPVVTESCQNITLVYNDSAAFYNKLKKSSLSSSLCNSTQTRTANFVRIVTHK